jgi:(p)ppGpp synthase/HD superfamily hydrolase
MKKLEDAIALACQYHAGQTDKIGEPYILHPIRVMLSMNSPVERIVAVLHDIIEDTDMTAEKLLELGYSKVAVDAIVSVTKVPGEEYRAYLLRVASNIIGAKVKRADISDNMSPIRLYKLPSEKRISLRDKYTKGLNILDSIEGK